MNRPDEVWRRGDLLCHVKEVNKLIRWGFLTQEYTDYRLAWASHWDWVGMVEFWYGRKLFVEND